MIPQGYEITGDMVPRVRNILGVPEMLSTALAVLWTSQSHLETEESLCPIPLAT